ncbi:MAG TPA: ELM1/GtrOC1 family putative glycosyltransferase [Verrucomicrobiae bacterium]
MSQSLQFIRVLSDGRPGHENQSVGLAEALVRRTGARLDIVRFAKSDWLWDRYRQAVTGGEGLNLLIGAGHKTHLALCLAARRLRAKSVVIMSPTWPVWFFDLCLAPQHDLRARLRTNRRVVTTFGALNRLPEQIPVKQPLGIVLVGGPSRHHGWDEGPLTAAIRAVIASRPELIWTVGDSRRTPAGFLDRLQTAGCRAQYAPHAQTTSAWLPAQLLASQEAWVTEDSISMAFEAVTAGARAGLLPVPRLRSENRVTESLRRLTQEGYATPFATWEASGRRLPPAKHLHETARVADLVLERWFNADSTVERNSEGAKT